MRQIVVLTASRVVAVTPDRGTLLWEFAWPYGQNPPQPVILGSRVFISTSSAFTSSVYHDGFIYGLDEFILACIDAATGDLKWKGGRYGYGQVMLANGHLIVVTEEGELALVRATPDNHQEVVRFAAIEGQTHNHPAIADGILLIRNANQMAAFDLRQK